MRHLRSLAVLPFLGILIGPFFLNSVEPFVLGLPLLLAWLVVCVIGTSAVMGVIYLTDPGNRVRAEDPR